MKTSGFDFDLPENLIAQNPLKKRDGSRLLHLPKIEGAVSDRAFTELPDLLAQNEVSLLVVNDTKVIPARLFGKKTTGGQVEFMLLEPQKDVSRWIALAKASKPLKQNTTVSLDGGEKVLVESRLDEGRYIVCFESVESAKNAIDTQGVMPLPPYIRRDRGGGSDQRRADLERYQTVYAKYEGAVAAPTAGLHFTPELIEKIESLGIRTVSITLHVGAGTFAPVRADAIEDHTMHTESYAIGPAAAQAINSTLDEGGKIVSVGTTSLRALESATDSNGRVRAEHAATDIFIYPGYRFRTVSGLVTNFHLPRSTLIMLVSALAGRDRILSAYRHAISKGYRFYSYGDAMLIL